MFFPYSYLLHFFCFSSHFRKVPKSWIQRWCLSSQPLWSPGAKGWPGQTTRSHLWNKNVFILWSHTREMYYQETQPRWLSPCIQNVCLCISLHLLQPDLVRTQYSHLISRFSVEHKTPQGPYFPFSLGAQVRSFAENHCLFFFFSVTNTVHLPAALCQCYWLQSSSFCLHHYLTSPRHRTSKTLLQQTECVDLHYVGATHKPRALLSVKSVHLEPKRCLRHQTHK